MNRRDRRAAGRKPQKNPGGSGFDAPAASCAAGLQHLQAGRYLDAQICCQQALSVNPDHADALHLMGLLSLQTQQYDHAVEWISRAIRQEPRPEYLWSLGTTLRRAGRREEALQAFDKAVQLRPDDADLRKDLGDVLLDLSRPAEALLSYQQALKLKPQHWDAANQSGIVLHGLGQLEESILSFDLCDRLRPNHFATLHMRAICLCTLRGYEHALPEIRRAQALDPDNADISHNVGIVLQSFGRDHEALEWFDQALKLRPDFKDALHNKAVSLARAHRFPEAFAIYDGLKAVDPNDAFADLGRAHLQLLAGNFEAGWAGREARWKLPSSYPKLDQPMWLGNSALEGKTILIGADEGFGDTIQFARYVPMLAARGARVVLVVQDTLHPLLSELPGVSQCIPISATRTNALPAFDLHCPIMSLPLAFGTRLDTIPAPMRYLPDLGETRVQAWEDRLQDHLGPRSKLRVGLVWSGNPKHKNDRNRSLSLRTLTRILDVDANFVSLQKDLRPDDKAVLLERTDIVDLTAHLSDFAETAALVSCLDLVITVDTSVAHLAAALGRPTWILLPYAPDYRWLLDRDDSPWYPTVRLFRQTETRDYGEVLDRVRNELQTLIATRRDRTAPDGGIGQNPEPKYLSSLGITLEQQGRLEEAFEAFDKAAQLKPDDAGLWTHRGKVLTQLERPADALQSFQQALKHDPHNWDAACQSGILLYQSGRLEEALAQFDLCNAIQPNHAPTLYMRAVFLRDLGRFEEALADNRRAHALDPDNVDTCNNIGSALQSLDRYEEALQWFDRTLALQPNFVGALYNKAVSFSKIRRFDEAFSIYQRLKILDLNNTVTDWDLALLLYELGHPEDALVHFNASDQQRPDHALTLSMRALCFYNLKRFEECLADNRRAQALDPNSAFAEWNLAHLHLLTGNFEAGWIMREARWRMPTSSAHYPKFSQPMWLGQEAIAGKTILIQADEGLGDTIQVIRYAPMMAARGARVILVVENLLHSLLSKLPGVSACFPKSAADQLPPFDMHCPIMTLPLAFGTRLDTIPAAIPYLPSPAANRVQAWEERLGPHHKLRVGLVWSGNPLHKNDRNRSISLRALSRILDVDAAFVSLQKDPGSDDQAILRERPDIIDLTADLTDFAETAALVSCLDLVITVDTSIAHLAGALGRPTWILLSYVPDWRWLLDRDDSPWYPTVRLFRQTETREYASVLDRVRSELQALIVAPRDRIASVREHPAPISELAPASPDALCAAGLHHMQAGRYPDAQICYQQALSVNPDHADALHLMGQQSLQSQQYDQAVEWIARAIRQDPKPEYLTSLGTTLRHQGRHDEALKTYDKALQLKPDDADLWHNLGEVLFTLNRPTDALLSFQHALKLDPRHWGAMHNSGLLLHQQGRFEEALNHFDSCNELRPDNISTLRMRAVSLRELKRFAESLLADRQVYALDPADIETCHNIGAVLRVLGQYEEALEWFDKALALRPNLIQALNNKASSLAQLQRFDEAFAVYDLTKALGLNNALTDWNLALLHMLTGNFEAGWAGREARWHLSSVSAKYPIVSGPKWLGKEPLDGKTILICVDEGLGDAIQFARYVPMLAARGARVILAVQEPLCVLLSAVPGVSLCVPISPTVSTPPFDFHCPMSSLPLAFATRLDTIPAEISYLPRPDQARVQAWEARLGPHDRLRVGLVWSGNPDHLDDRHRSIPLQAFSRMLDADAAFISLQKDLRLGDKPALLERTDIVDLTAHLTDFTETAALVSCLDLVITVDTSVAHLAGALGCPTWILLPHTPDYRWLLDRDDSPWYPTVRLFRQSEIREYDSVLDRVRSELHALIAAASGSHQQLPVADPVQPDTLHMLGVLSLQAQQYDQALDWITRAVRLDPKPEYLSSLGITLRCQRRYEEALKTFDKALQLKPDDPELWKNLGHVLVELERPTDALLSFQHALGLDPNQWDATYDSASLLHRLGRFEEALRHFDLCDGLRPNHALTLQARALAFHGLQRFEEALADNQRSHQLDPANVATNNNIGDALQSLARYDEALPWFERALELKPDFIAAAMNKASALIQIRRFEEAIAAYRRVKMIDGNHAEAELGLGHLHLLMGNFEAGWVGQEARLKIASTSYPKFPEPRWLGDEPIEGKTILLYTDEGLGDLIQFARYIPMLAARGAIVIVVVANAAHRLLSGFPGISQCIAKSAGEPLPAFDMHSPLSSLPLAFRTRLDTIPCSLSYLPPPAETLVQAWERRLGPHDRLRVGLVWSGNPQHNKDHKRSIPLRMLSRILEVDATFVSLQKDPRPHDQAVLGERSDIIDLTAQLTDLSETAALVTCLDLVITVDTSVAHLAGALGCPTWILLPHTPDYRWLLDRDDSPWYPTVRLFRQSETRDYDEVLDRVRSELQKLIATDPRRSGVGTPASLYDAGRGHMKAGRYLDAQVCGEQALAINSDHADSLHLMGLLSHQAKQNELAVEWISRAAEQDPKPEYLSNLGAMLRHLGRHEEACKAFETAVRLKPDDAALWKSFGNVQGQLSRPAEAASSFQQALRLKPDDWDAANKCGMLLDQLGRLEQALPYFDLCDELRPNDSQTLHRRAMCLCGLKRFEQALGDLERTHALDPDNIENTNNIGVALQSLGRDEESLGWFDRTLERLPDRGEVLTNKAISLGKLHRHEEAIAMLHRVETIDPNNAIAALSLGHLHLLMGNFEPGWAGHEARLKTRSATSTTYPHPRWFGEGSVEGKTILIHADEGLGDTIQFARYVPMLAARGARVILVVQPAAHALLSKLPGVAQCFSQGVEALPAFELQCSISSLPLAFGTRLDTIPSGASYLPLPPASLVQAWEDRLGSHNKLRVGLVWSGNPNHDNDHNRSIQLRALSRIIDVDATFVSLQKDPRPQDKATLRERPDIVDLTADLTDFVATAALLSCLDLAISVDTSVAHLAAALGRPTWILLPHAPDYRWLLDRTDSPWYPTVRLFRQTATREYASVLDRVRSELQALIAAKHDRTAPGGGIRQNPEPEHLSSHGIALQQQGRLEDAFKAFDESLQLKPDDAGLWIHRGKVLVQLARPADALQSFQQALKHDPHHWDAACQSGILLYQSGRLAEALAQFDRCDKLQPNHAPTLYMRAVFLRDLGRFEEALADDRRAHTLDPDNADTCNNIGNDLHSLNRDEEALQWFDRALALRSDFVGALYNKAVSLGKIDRSDEAFAIYQRLKTLDLTNAVTDWNLAILLNDLGRFEDALVHFNLSDQQRPHHAPTLSMRARCFYNLKRFEECLADNRRAHALDPTDADICNFIGDALQLLRRYGEALTWFDRATALRANFVEALLNRAFSLRQLHRFRECFSTYDDVKAIDPNNAVTDWNLAHLHLLTGNFEAGWALREVRWRMPLFSARYPKFSQPMWLGEEAIAGKTILIQADEGLGDTIQFVRYVPMLAARGARVVLVVDSPLRSLLSRLSGVSECLPVSAADSLPPFDMHCPVMRLPLSFGTRLDTIPADTPYLPSPAADRVQAWEDRLGPHVKPRVGLVWSGNPKQMNDHNRSMPLRHLLRILDVDAIFVSLQKDPKPDDKAILRERPDIIDLTADLTDFTETAALISCLDLVISVDTSVAHLAAAFGRPTWILLAYLPDWRWLLDREDCPWYPTARLFRQTETRDYRSVVERVRTELLNLISARQLC